AVVGLAKVIPHRGDEVVVVGRIDGDVDAAGGGVRRLERSLPGVTAVGGVVDAALPSGHEEVAADGHPDPLGLLRVDDDPADVAGRLESHVLPGVPTVGRPVHSLAAVGDAAA